MNFRIQIAQLYIPDFIKKQKLRELSVIAARGLQCQEPDYRSLSYSESLQRFAEFTHEHASRQSDPLAGKQKLFDESFVLGQKLARQFRIASFNEAMQLCRIIYQAIGIEFDYAANHVCIKSCFFSKVYSSQVCRIISGLDEGLIAGLTGRRLEFKERITEDRPCCLAEFTGV